MDWAKKNYERLVLGFATAVLLLSGLDIFWNALHFQFNDALSHPPQRPAAPPGKANELDLAVQNLAQPSQWTFGGRSGLFVPEKHFIGANGQPATLQSAEVHPPVPNAWFEQFGLRIEDADALEQDPDGDGFTNLDEFQGHTNPTDKNSHPDYLTKLKMKSFKEEQFRMKFDSKTGDTFIINTTDLKEPTQFLKIGDVIAGTRFKLVRYTEKSAANLTTGGEEDVSELLLENTETSEPLTLVKEKVAMSPEAVADFVYTWKDAKDSAATQGQEFSVRKGAEFSLRPLNETRYKLIDVQPTKAVIVNMQKPDAPIEIGLLKP